MNFLCQAGAMAGLTSRYCQMEIEQQKELREKFIKHAEEYGLLIGTKEEFDFRFQIFAEKSGVSRIVAETSEGLFGVLPRRLDCVAALVPGILIYETEAEGEVYVAVDEGVLVKTGPDVLVSVRKAFSGSDLGQLREVVEREFLSLDEHEQSVRLVLAKMESGFIRRLVEFHHE